MPFALDEIRKLGKLGHEVHAADTFATAPGSHSRYVARSHRVASPRFETAEFLAQIARIVDELAIDRIIPAFEEVFYLSKLAERLPRGALFAPSFEVLARLHDKERFRALATELGVKTPATVTCRSQEQLRRAAARFGAFFARPAYSRGGVELCTNTGPLAGVLPLEDCRPTPANPWLVQEFVHGIDVCTFSVCQHGRITAHAAYVHPREIEHAGGIVFESVDEPEALRVARRIAARTGYHGQLSLDFLKTDRGLFAIECNPRPTAGVYLMTAQAFEHALLFSQTDPLVVRAGVRRKISIALVRDMVLHWREIPKDVPHLLSSARDVYAEPGDVVPALYQVLSYSHVLAYRRQHPGKHSPRDLMAAYFHDILWDGEPIEDLPPQRTARDEDGHAALRPS
jgi:predicted ATP-grasp superfamily ATP-dependent carboligase